MDNWAGSKTQEVPYISQPLLCLSCASCGVKLQNLILTRFFTAISHFANGASTQHKIASESQQKLLHIPNTIAAFTRQYCVKIQFYNFCLKSIILF